MMMAISSSTTRLVANRNARVLRLQPPKCMSSTTSLAGSSSPPRLVLSRRVWQAHLEKMPKQPKGTNTTKVKPDDKPWPRNVKIGAGVAACIVIPYTTLWLITSNPTLRNILGPYLPLDQLRTHFGSLEWDAQSFVDQGDPIPPGCYQYPLELSFRDRLQQAIIESADQATTTAKIYLLGDSQQEQVKKVPASAKANPETLASLVGAQLDPGIKVAVVFEDPEPSEDEMDGSQVEMVTFEDEKQNPEDIPTKSLLKETVTYSTWYYTPVVTEETERAQRSSDMEIDRLRLEYTVKKLEKDLRDPTCTRDHDEMRAELKQAKSDLSRLKWKRRLGL